MDLLKFVDPFVFIHHLVLLMLAIEIVAIEIDKL